MLAYGDGEATPNAAEVSKATSVILVEARAASLAARLAAARQPPCLRAGSAGSLQPGGPGASAARPSVPV
jgi:hypothetical protein